MIDEIDQNDNITASMNIIAKSRQIQMAIFEII